MTDLIWVHPDVREALEARLPVVALETTLVSHGFPSGEGGSVAREAERLVREGGAVPATIGVLEGAIRVGLGESDLDAFTASRDAWKVGPRDLAACVQRKALGATTVGGTLAVCRAVGIGFMATGGIGGVHRGFAETLDVSSDLGELARTQALVVCSGAKSILDVPATSELLETLAIPVLGYRTDTLPLFYAAEGGPPVSARVEEAAEAAEIARLHWRLGRHSAVLLAQPPSQPIVVEGLVEAALDEARERGARGRDVTPAVLAALHERSGGRTVETNRRLIADNAALAAAVAVAYARAR